MAGAITQVKKRYKWLEKRYGPKYTKGHRGHQFLQSLFPIAGSWVVSSALIVTVAEVHRAISKRGGLPEAMADLVVFVKANMPFGATGRWPSPPC